VLADGTLLLAGRVTSPAELFERLSERRSVHGGDLEVRIRGDRGAAYARVEPILLACARAGIWNVSFAVEARGEVN
jgi:biopolymer transport protein ExbD